MVLIKTNIFLVNVVTLIKLNLLKSHDFFKCTVGTLSLKKNLYLNPMGTYKGPMLYLKKKKPNNPKKEGCSTLSLKLTIMQTICKRM